MYLYLCPRPPTPKGSVYPVAAPGKMGESWLPKAGDSFPSPCSLPSWGSARALPPERPRALTHSPRQRVPLMRRRGHRGAGREGRRVQLAVSESAVEMAMDPRSSGPQAPGPTKLLVRPGQDPGILLRPQVASAFATHAVILSPARPATQSFSLPCPC